MRALQKSAALAQAILENQSVCNSIIRSLSTKKRDAIRAKLQAPGHEPVWMRGGPADKVLCGITCALVAFGVAHSFYRFYQRA